MVSSTALLIGDARTDGLRVALERSGYATHCVRRYDEASLLRERTSPAVVVIVCDGAAGAGALAAARALRTADARLPIVLAVHGGSEAFAVDALRAGVTDYLPAPWTEHDLRRATGTRAASDTRPPAGGGIPAMVGASRAMQHIRDYVQTVGATDTNVLVTGETGTGKELVAQLLHAHSPRRQRAFVSINCAAIPDTLLESELFGHERGAFTGAHAAHEGHLRAADGGTVMLDEIGEMTAYAQAKVLRALDSREVYRLGSTRRLPLDIRVIAATNQDLPALIDAGRFRKDLYYRLNVARVRLPALRERREDIPGLVEHYVRELNGRFQREVQGFTAEALQQLVEYDWPGNVREVKNMIEGAFAELPPRVVTFLDAPAALRDRLREAPPVAHGEREQLIAALAATKWNKSRAADRLHWSRMTLYRKLAKYDLHDPT